MKKAVEILANHDDVGVCAVADGCPEPAAAVTAERLRVRLGLAVGVVAVAGLDMALVLSARANGLGAVCSSTDADAAGAAAVICEGRGNAVVDEITEEEAETEGGLAGAGAMKMDGGCVIADKDTDLSKAGALAGTDALASLLLPMGLGFCPCACGT